MLTVQHLPRQVHLARLLVLDSYGLNRVKWECIVPITTERGQNLGLGWQQLMLMPGRV